MTSLRIAAATAAVLVGGAALASPFVAVPGQKEFTGELIVRPIPASTWISRGVSASEAVARTNATFDSIKAATRRTVRETGEAVVRLPAGATENGYAASLMATGRFEYAVPNWRLYPLRTPNDPQFSRQWHHPVLRSAEAWDIHTGTNTITVGICDTGVDLTHPDLQRNLVSGYNAPDRKAQVDGGQVQDINGHGTHVAGDAAAPGNNGIGVAGMGWNFRIMPIRVSNSPGGGASMDDLLDGARWAAQHGARVANVSYSGVDYPPIQTTGAFMRTLGSQLVWAAGNDNRDLSGFDHLDVTVVGASNEADGKAGFSAYGKGVDVFAPGTNILSTTLGGGYGGASGTSMASPVCAGVLAMIFSLNPKLTPEQAETLLEQSAVKIGPETIFGFGRVSLLGAMQRTFLTLTVESIALPSAITRDMGTLVTGDLSSVFSADARSYVLASQKFVLGQITSVTADFTIPNMAKVVKVSPAVVATSTITARPVVGTLFLWNYSTRRFDAVETFTVPPRGMTAVVKSYEMNGFRNYASSTGQVKMIVRGHTADGRTTGPAERFTLSLNQAVLRVESLR